MNQFLITGKFTFTASRFINAETEDEARENFENETTLGDDSPGSPDSTDMLVDGWEFDSIEEVEDYGELEDAEEEESL